MEALRLEVMEKALPRLSVRDSLSEPRRSSSEELEKSITTTVPLRTLAGATGES